MPNVQCVLHSVSEPTQHIVHYTNVFHKVVNLSPSLLLSFWCESSLDLMLSLVTTDQFHMWNVEHSSFC